MDNYYTLGLNSNATLFDVEKMYTLLKTKYQKKNLDTSNIDIAYLNIKNTYDKDVLQFIDKYNTYIILDTIYNLKKYLNNNENTYFMKLIIDTLNNIEYVYKDIYNVNSSYISDKEININEFNNNIVKFFKTEFIHLIRNFVYYIINYSNEFNILLNKLKNANALLDILNCLNDNKENLLLINSVDINMSLTNPILIFKNDNIKDEELTKINNNLKNHIKSNIKKNNISLKEYINIYGNGKLRKEAIDNIQITSEDIYTLNDIDMAYRYFGVAKNTVYDIILDKCLIMICNNSNADDKQRIYTYFNLIMKSDCNALIKLQYSLIEESTIDIYVDNIKEALDNMNKTSLTFNLSLLLNNYLLILDKFKSDISTEEDLLKILNLRSNYIKDIYNYKKDFKNNLLTILNNNLFPNIQYTKEVREIYNNINKLNNMEDIIIYLFDNLWLINGIIAYSYYLEITNDYDDIKEEYREYFDEYNLIMKKYYLDNKDISVDNFLKVFINQEYEKGLNEYIKSKGIDIEKRKIDYE